MPFCSLESLQEFVRALDIPEERREVLLAELEDHFFCELAEVESSGVPREEAAARALATIGEPEALLSRFLAAERAFFLTRRAAASCGARAGVTIALAVIGARLLRLLVFLVRPDPPEPTIFDVVHFGVYLGILGGGALLALHHLPERILRARRQPGAFAILVAVTAAGVVLAAPIDGAIASWGAGTSIAFPEFDDLGGRILAFETLPLYPLLLLAVASRFDAFRRLERRFQEIRLPWLG